MIWMCERDGIKTTVLTLIKLEIRFQPYHVKLLNADKHLFFPLVLYIATPFGLDFKNPIFLFNDHSNWFQCVCHLTLDGTHLIYYISFQYIKLLDGFTNQIVIAIVRNFVETSPLYVRIECGMPQITSHTEYHLVNHQKCNEYADSKSA